LTTEKGALRRHESCFTIAIAPSLHQQHGPQTVGSHRYWRRSNLKHTAANCNGKWVCPVVRPQLLALGSRKGEQFRGPLPIPHMCLYQLTMYIHANGNRHLIARNSLEEANRRSQPQSLTDGLRATGTTEYTSSRCWAKLGRLTLTMTHRQSQTHAESGPRMGSRRRPHLPSWVKSGMRTRVCERTTGLGFREV